MPQHIPEVKNVRRKVPFFFGVTSEEPIAKSPSRLLAEATLVTIQVREDLRHMPCVDEIILDVSTVDG